MQHEKMKQLFAGTGINCLKTGANKTVIAAPAPADEHIAPATARSARASGGTHRASASRVRSASAHDQNKTTQISRRAPHLSQNESSARRQPLQPPARNGYGNRALRTPSRLAEHYLCHSVTWYEKCVHVVSAHHKSADTLDRLGASCVRRTPRD